MSLQVLIEKAKTEQQIDEELKALIPKHPLEVPFDSPKWKPYDKKQQEKYVSVDDLKQWQEQSVKNLLGKISTEMAFCTTQLRDETLKKSERRIGVLHSRIEMLMWVTNEFNEVLGLPLEGIK